MDKPYVVVSYSILLRYHFSFHLFIPSFSLSLFLFEISRVRCCESSEVKKHEKRGHKSADASEREKH